MKRITMVSIVIVALVVALPAATQVLGPANEYLVEFAGPTPSGLAGMVAAAGGRLHSVMPEIGAAVALSENAGFARKLVRNREIRRVTRDFRVRWSAPLDATGATAIPGPSAENGGPPDPEATYFYPCQWNMRQIDAPGAWDEGVFGDPTVKVAVLDSGVDPYHQDLAGKVDLTESVSLLSSSPCGDDDTDTIYDLDGHGTVVASLITGNSIDMASVAPDAMIVAVKIGDCEGSGTFGDLIAGIVYAAGLDDVHVINMSRGAYFPKNLPGGGPLLAAVSAAVNYAVSQGKLVVSSAGNDGANLDHDGNGVHIPSQAGAGIGVYATGNLDTLASYSNYGVSGTWVGAPGGDYPNTLSALAGCSVDTEFQGLVIGACTSFYTPCASGNYYFVTNLGTSFAAPMVAGVAALVDGEAGGALSGQQLMTILSRSADDLGRIGVDTLYSHGRVNAARAIELWP